MNEQDINEETKEKINTLLNDLYEMPKYKIINALLALSECAIMVVDKDISTPELMEYSVKTVETALECSKSQEEWHPGSVIEKKKGNVVSLFHYAA